MTDYERGKRDGLMAMAEWADQHAEHWQGETYRHQALIGVSMNRIKHHGASRMANWYMHKMALFREVAAEARRLAGVEEE